MLDINISKIQKSQLSFSLVYFLQRVGCDLKIGSGLQVDACGVCGGDGSSCTKPLYHWMLTPMSLCSVTCGGGNYIRKDIILKLSTHLFPRNPAELNFPKFQSHLRLDSSDTRPVFDLALISLAKWCVFMDIQIELWQFNFIKMSLQVCGETSLDVFLIVPVVLRPLVNNLIHIFICWVWLLILMRWSVKLLIFSHSSTRFRSYLSPGTLLHCFMFIEAENF